MVATPIGNLSDITLRALETLKKVDVVLCEDTRVTRVLLDHYNIKIHTLSYHQHSTERKVKEIIALLAEGKNLALVTDAGTPGISDPGNKLISEIVACHSPEKGNPDRSLNGMDHRLRGDDIRIVPIPGPSAVIAALSVSGFPTDKFVFMGFPPHKKKRQKFFKEVAEAEYTVVFYESSHRIKKCIGELHEVLDSGRRVVICRELTKKFESVYRGTIEKISKIEIPEKGEFVVIIQNLKIKDQNDNSKC